MLAYVTPAARSTASASPEPPDSPGLFKRSASRGWITKTSSSGRNRYGFQRKALVARADDGTWQLPFGDGPSTWILKPDGPHAMAANEATRLRLAAACGLDVPDIEIVDLDGLVGPSRQALRPSPLTQRAGTYTPGRRLPGDKHTTRAQI